MTLKRSKRPPGRVISRHSRHRIVRKFGEHPFLVSYKTWTIIILDKKKLDRVSTSWLPVIKTTRVIQSSETELWSRAELYHNLTIGMLLFYSVNIVGVHHCKPDEIKWRPANPDSSSPNAIPRINSLNHLLEAVGGEPFNSPARKKTSGHSCPYKVHGEPN